MNQISKKGLLLFILCWLALGIVPGQTLILPNKQFSKVGLPEVLEWLKKTYKVSIAYSKDAMKMVTVSEQINDLSIEEVLDKITQNTHLTYQKVNDTRFIVGPRPEKSTPPEQKYWITGVIKGGDGPCFTLC